LFDNSPGFAPALLAAFAIALPPPVLLAIALGDPTPIRIAACVFTAILFGMVGGKVFWLMRLRAERRWWKGERPW
jgi:hypothetical protein